MTIQNIAISNTHNFGVTGKHAFTTLINNTKNQNEPLTPEQRNTLQDDINAKVTEQANNIKSNFQTAKEVDLTRAYYEQQQKLIDIYMQTDTKSESSISATETLTDTYASLYNLHKSIKDGDQQLPSNPENTQPSNDITSIGVTWPLTDKQTNTYNNYMMPTTNSYLHLQA